MAFSREMKRGKFQPETHMDIELRDLTETDVELLTPIMTRAFDHDTKIHTVKVAGGPPGYNDGTFLNKWALHPHSTAFCIYLDDELAGAIILWIFEHHENRLGCVFLDPHYESQGIGTRVWKMVEKMYPQTLIWVTETPLFSHRNQNFYINKCGFHAVAIENPRDHELGCFVLRKEMTPSPV